MYMNTNIKSIFVAMLATCSLFVSCGNDAKDGTKSNQPTVQNLVSDSNAAKQILFLRLLDEVDTDSSKVYMAKALYEADTVAVKVEILKNIEPGIDANGQPKEDGFIKGAIKFSSIGVASDNFVKALGKVFAIEGADMMSTDVVLPTVFSSNKNVVDLSKTTSYNFKLFFENQTTAPAEVFAVVDTYRKAIEISEKDSTYRRGLVAAFQGK